MDNNLVLKMYVDGINDTPFPSASNQLQIVDFTYNAKRMGDAPTISATLMNEQCLDDIWTENVYAEFNGEKFFLKQTPTSSYSNDDTRYKHELDLVSERRILNDVYFYDVVASDTTSDKPVSNSSNVSFFGDIHEFAQRMNYSLQYAKLQTVDEDGNYVSGYRLIVDDGIETEGKLMTFDNAFMANVLQEVYNTYEVPYYFVGKDIHIGDSPNKIETPFQYGVNNALLSIAKENANFKVVNRATGIGSSDNIPYYYPNATERGDLSVLLNGETKGIKIKNPTAINKFGLNDTLTYVYDDNGYFVDFYEDAKITTRATDLDREDEEHYTYYIQHSTEFYIPVSSRAVDTNIEVQLVDETIGNASIILYHNKRAIDSKYANSNEMYEFTDYIESGTYYLEIAFYTKQYPLPDNYFDNIRIRIYQHDSTIKNYWTKDGRYVDPKELGIQFPDDLELTNGDALTIRQDKYIKPQTNLMPPRYRKTNGDNRFYNALNYAYIVPDTNPREFYHFNNPYIDGKPKEQIVSFEDIKPTIVGIKNGDGRLIGMFTEFAYDLNDNDETEDIEGTTYYKHPFFFGKLRKFDGEYGFNLFDHAIEESEMVVSFTDGSCGACEFTIVVSEEAQENLVQVYEEDTTDENGIFHAKGTLKYDKNGNVICGREHYQSAVDAQDIQNDTINNEVWVALRKDDATFGVIMPNAQFKYKPKACTTADSDDGDAFVLLHIDLPQAYIDAAEKRLENAIIDYMANNNDEKFNFSITFSRIYLAEHPEIYNALNENTHLQIVYNNRIYPLYVSSYSYKIGAEDALPEIKVDLSDTLTIVQNALQNAISEVKGDMFTMIETFYNPSSSNAEDPKVAKKYLRKDIADTATKPITFEQGINLGNNSFIDGKGNALLNRLNTNDDKTGITQSSSRYNPDPLLGYGYAIEHETNGAYKLTIDKIVARQSMTVSSLVVQEYKSVGGVMVISHANGEIKDVKISEDGLKYNIYLKEWDEQPQFMQGDFIRCSKWDKESLIYTTYWVKVVGVMYTEDGGYIQCLVSDFEQESTSPEVGDTIVQFGSTIENRQGMILLSVEDGKPRMDAYDGINSNAANALKNALKARFGKLDGIVDNGTELNGYGIYSESLYLGMGDSATNIFKSIADEFLSVKSEYSLNLLDKTNQGTTNWIFGSGGVITVVIYDANQLDPTTKGVFFEKIDGYNAPWEVFNYPVLSEYIKNGKTYTLSFEVKSVGGTSSQMQAYLIQGSTTYSAVATFDNVTADEEWVKMTATITANKDGVESGKDYITLTLGMVTKDTWSGIFIRNMMLTEGTDVLPYKASEDNALYSRIQQTANSIRLEIVDDLKTTGINIENGQIDLQANKVNVKNNDGETTAMFDANGKLSTAIIDASSLYVQRIIALDRNVTPHQVVSTINVIENDGFYYTHYPVSYNSNGEPISSTVYKVVEGYNIGYPASANGYNAETDSIATVYDAYGTVRWRLVVGDDNTFGVVGVGDKWEPLGLRLLSENTSTDADILEDDYEDLEYPTSVSFNKDSNGKWVATPTYNSYEVLIPLTYKKFVPGANSAYESYRSFVKSWDGNSNSLKNDYTFVGTLTGKYLTTSRPIQSAITEFAGIRRVTVSYTWEIEVYENGQYIQTLRTSRGYIYDY